VAEVDHQQFIRTALGTTAATVSGPFVFADAELIHRIGSAVIVS
jgi:hypothetical protein